MSKTPAPASSPTKASAKTAVTAAAAPAAAHAPAKAKHAAAEAEAKPAAKAAVKVATKAASPKSGDTAMDTMSTKSTLQAPAPKPAGKSSAKAAASKVDTGPAMVHAPLVGSSRFADRFAPPKPPTRQMNSPVIDTPRIAAKPDPKLANAWKTKSGREMSEAEIFAMPDSEYMNDKQLDFFRGKLQELKEDLLSNAGETTEHLREDTSIVPDPADRATIEEEHALELRTRDRERKLLKKITQSLARLDTGEYGYCDETGEPIGLGRLIARPTATLSLEAQQRREMKQKMFGD
ncbi:MAG: RNA polymerase-binding protein DksA [Burkholderiaceae bacterium]|nr:RNA polymerase-binding protein DksA [Burkholderiaceae bacterium]